MGAMFYMIYTRDKNDTKQQVKVNGVVLKAQCIKDIQSSNRYEVEITLPMSEKGGN